MSVSEPTQSWKISDHWFIKATLGIIRQIIDRKTIHTRTLKNIVDNNFREALSYVVDVCKNIADPATLFLEYDNRLREVVEQQAPMKEKRVITRQTIPSMDDEIIAEKRIVRQAERKLKNDPSEGNKQHHKQLLKKHRQFVKHKKKSYINSKISACGNRTKKLYSLVNSLVGRIKSNRLPETTDDKLLAEKFSEFFFNQINPIRNDLKGYREFHPKSLHSGPELIAFEEFVV